MGSDVTGQKSRTFYNQLEKTNIVCLPSTNPRAEMIFCLNWIELNALYPLVWFFPLGLAAIVFNHPNESRDVTMTNFWLFFSFRCSDSESSPPKKFLLFLSFWYHEDHSHTVFWDFGVRVAVFEHYRNQLLFSIVSTVFFARSTTLFQFFFSNDCPLISHE